MKTLIPKQLCNIWPILSRFYSMKVKAHKIAISKCGSLKMDERKQTFWHEDLSCGSVSHKGTPTSTLLKHSRRVLLPGNQVSSVNTITVILIPIFTKGDCPQGGVSVPRTISSTPLHTKPEGRWLAGEPPRLQGCRRTEIQVLIYSRTTHKAATPYSLTGAADFCRTHPIHRFF